MREILMANAAPLMSEHIMLELSDEIGRQRAHDLVHDAIVASRDGARTFAEALFEDDTVRRHYGDRDALERALSPEHYTPARAARSRWRWPPPPATSPHAWLGNLRKYPRRRADSPE
ncbi:hypothetical protein [Salinicola tamaricis]|uniref:hypothetical protein n=1 Tax=Salinicola tamaricis TaxID=1771309 RepID=UPI0013EDFA1A|nr:hypothetical protein [Salinicola tamaricis]